VGAGEPSLEVQQLDRHSFVPLYYQLQEVLKERIESGFWRPEDALPSEPELARAYGVSRVVVRQALAILEDDHQILRVRGRGTFVARPKLDFRAGGLSRLLADERGSDTTIQVLDKRTASVERSIRAALDLTRETDVLRITTLLSVKGVPIAIAYSFFAAQSMGWLVSAAQVGRNLPGSLTLAEHGITLAHSRLSIEASQCGQFEADRFGVPHRSAVFLVLCTEYRDSDEGTCPFEVARVEYRGDLLQFRLNAASSSGDQMSAIYELNDDAEALVARGA